MSNIQSNKRVAKNTAVLYFRMLVTMVVSIYTSRVVLEALGIIDYGIYSVVGGIVSIVSILSGSMRVSTQRYLTFELGNNNLAKLSDIFSNSIIIHCVIALGIVLISETFGLWFLFNKINIPPEKLQQAFWVFQFSILTTVVLFINIPYSSLVIAKENMSIFAYIAILEVVLKLALAFVITVINSNRLVVYAALMMLIQLSVQEVYHLYCKRNYPDIRFSFKINRGLCQEMIQFAGWNMWGQGAAVLFIQGVTLLLNIFFGPAVNAARALAIQVQAAVVSFSQNFQTALNPQIIKSYASNDVNRMYALIYSSSKYSFFLLFLFIFPIIVEAPFILNLWLKEVPDYTDNFLRVILMISAIDVISNSLMVAASATGKVRLYQSVIGGWLLLIVPVSYFVLKSGGDPLSVFIVHFIMGFMALLVRIYIVRRLIDLSFMSYLKRVFWPIIKVVVFDSTIIYGLKSFSTDSAICSLSIIVLSLVLSLPSIFYLGLNFQEREFVLDAIKKIKVKLLGA